jgi:hypothetical protein
MIAKVVSGGQTGVDRAALDFALENGLPCGGWCPATREAEDGTIPTRYPLMETLTGDHAQRTEWNVRDSDATLIITRGPPTGGTALTIQFAKRRGKPYLVLDLNDRVDPTDFREWCRRTNINILNVAGPRESKAPEIYKQAKALLHELFP